MKVVYQLQDVCVDWRIILGGAHKFLARPGRKEANVSVRMA